MQLFQYKLLARQKKMNIFIPWGGGGFNNLSEQNI